MTPSWPRPQSRYEDGFNLSLPLGRPRCFKDFYLQLDSKTATEQWRRQILSLGQVKLAISLKYCRHPIGPPKLTSQEQPVFGVPIATVAQ